MTEFNDTKRRLPKAVSSSLFRSAIEECARETTTLRRLIAEYKGSSTTAERASVQGKIEHSKQILFQAFDEATKHKDGGSAKELQQQEDTAERVLEELESLVPQAEPLGETSFMNTSEPGEDKDERIQRIHR